MRAAIWARVSTSEQDASNQSLVLHRWALELGHEVVREYRVEESAYKGAHLQQLEACLTDATEYDVLLVWALDRLSRQGAEATLGLVRRFADAGVLVWSHQESWTLADGALLELLLAIAGWVAKQESSRRSERTLAGLSRRRALGLPMGRQVGAKDKRPRKKRAKVALG